MRNFCSICTEIRQCFKDKTNSFSCNNEKLLENDFVLQANIYAYYNVKLEYKGFFKLKSYSYK